MQEKDFRSTVTKVAVLTETLSSQQKAMFLTKALNEISYPYKNIDASVFCLDGSAPPIIPRFGVLPMVKAFGHEAIFFATSLETASLLINFPAAVKKYFYVWDLEWVYNNHDYQEMVNAYCNDELDLIARSNFHFDAIKNSWKEPVAIMEDFETNAMMKLIMSNRIEEHCHDTSTN